MSFLSRVSRFTAVVVCLSFLLSLVAFSPKEARAEQGLAAGFGAFPALKAEYDGAPFAATPGPVSWNTYTDFKGNCPTTGSWTNVPGFLQTDGITAGFVELRMSGYSSSESREGGSGVISSFSVTAMLATTLIDSHCYNTLGVGAYITINGAGSYVRTGNLIQMEISGSAKNTWCALRCENSPERAVKIRASAFLVPIVITNSEQSCIRGSDANSEAACYMSGVFTVNCLEPGCQPGPPPINGIPDPIEALEWAGICLDGGPHYCGPSPGELLEVLENWGVCTNGLSPYYCGPTGQGLVQMAVCLVTQLYCNEPLPGLPLPDPSTVPPPGSCGYVNLGVVGTWYVCTPSGEPLPTIADLFTYEPPVLETETPIDETFAEEYGSQSYIPAIGTPYGWIEDLPGTAQAVASIFPPNPSKPPRNVPYCDDVESHDMAEPPGQEGFHFAVDSLGLERVDWDFYVSNVWQRERMANVLSIYDARGKRIFVDRRPKPGQSTVEGAANHGSVSRAGNPNIRAGRVITVRIKYGASNQFWFWGKDFVLGWAQVSCRIR